MKATGIIRRVDELGRVVLPIELRRSLEIEERDAMEISVDGDRIILRKHQPTCIFCGNDEELFEYREKRVCTGCLKNLNQAEL